MQTVRTQPGEVIDPPSDSGGAPSARQRMAWRLGIQGKLVLSFSILIGMALSISCWIFFHESRKEVARHSEQRVVQVAHLLGMTAAEKLKTGSVPELDLVARELMKHLDVSAVAFYDVDGKALSVACRDPVIQLANPGFLALPESPTQSLMRVVDLHTPTLGDFAMVTVPVIGRESADADYEAADRLLGYITVCLSENGEWAHLQKVQAVQILIGLLTLMCIVLLMYLLVQRIFQPIRQLVAATNRIADGDLTARVAIHRTDVIGRLARSFNRMAIKVKTQQENLEQTVQDRTAQLEETNARLKSEIAEKEDFLRAVSHDLNAPLRNIAGMAEMLLHKHSHEFDGEVIHRLNRIQKNAEVERDLINELLELSRIKTVRQHREMVDIEAMIHDLAGLFENDLKNRGISLEIEDRLPVIHGEKSRLRQVFQNLIDNAIKYMDDGSTREIRIGASIGLQAAEFYVRDTGQGIDAEDLGRVFHIFRRGKNAHSKQVGGKGVGLANVKSIIETYQGRIWVESTPGQGSVFRFTIAGQYVPAVQSRGVKNVKNDKGSTGRERLAT